MSKDLLEETVNLDEIFTYHPYTQDQLIRYTAIRAKAKEMAQVILDNCPPGTDKKIALIKIRECVMWAYASVALNPEEKRG